MPRMININHINLYARDPLHLATFYRDLLEMRVLWQLPDNQACFLAGPETQEGFDLAFFRSPKGEQVRDNIQPVSAAERTLSSPHICLRVARLADLRAAHQSVASLGGTFLFGVNHGVGLSCHILDPEGNQIELGWPTGRHSQRPVTAQIDIMLPDEELLRIVDESLAHAAI